jgi:hypothetical protein
MESNSIENGRTADFSRLAIPRAAGMLAGLNVANNARRPFVPVVGPNPCLHGLPPVPSYSEEILTHGPAARTRASACKVTMRDARRRRLPRPRFMILWRMRV